MHATGSNQRTLMLTILQNEHKRIHSLRASKCKQLRRDQQNCVANSEAISAYALLLLMPVVTCTAYINQM